MSGNPPPNQPQPSATLSARLGLGNADSLRLEYRAKPVRTGLVNAYIAHHFDCYSSGKNLLFSLDGASEPVQEAREQLASGTQDASGAARVGQRLEELVSWRQLYTVGDRNGQTVSQIIHSAGSANGLSPSPGDGESRMSWLSAPGVTAMTAQKRRIQPAGHEISIALPTGGVVAHAKKVTPQSVNNPALAFGVGFAQTVPEVISLDFRGPGGQPVGALSTDSEKPPSFWTNKGNISYRVKVGPGVDRVAILLGSFLHLVTPNDGSFYYSMKRV